MKRIWVSVAVLSLLALSLTTLNHPVATTVTHAVGIPVPGVHSQPSGFGWEFFNWSGYAIDENPGDFNSISGSWVVPATYPISNGPTYAANWLGIDGFNNDNLIQTGTGEQVLNGQIQYNAWWEILAAAETPIPMNVAPGDLMHATIFNLGDGEWQITIDEMTENESCSIDQYYDGPAESAEWIQEAPTVNGTVASLADYSSFPFTKLKVNGTDPYLNPLEGGSSSKTMCRFPRHPIRAPMAMRLPCLRGCHAMRSFFGHGRTTSSNCVAESGLIRAND
jgi:hypothetical protein